MTGNNETNKYPDKFPNSNISFHIPNLKLFYTYIYKRHKIWVKRFVTKQKPPWTNDKYLKDRKFTNVYRELDRNSVWLIKNILNIKNKNIDRFFQTVIFRIFNNPETFELYGLKNLTIKTFNFKKWLKFCIDMHKQKFNIFTSAYMITPPTKKDRIKFDIKSNAPRNELYAKITNEIHRSLNDKRSFNLWTEVQKANSFKKVCEIFSTIPYCGQFKAFQIAWDLLYGNKPLVPFTEDDYCNTGAGANLGLQLIFPNIKNNEILKKIRWLRDKQDFWFRKLNIKFPYLKTSKDKRKKLTLCVIENCLCEFSKYWKMIHNVGKQRLYFKPISKINLYDNL